MSGSHGNGRTTSVRRRLRGDRIEESKRPINSTTKSRWTRLLSFVKYGVLVLLIPPLLNYASIQHEARQLKPQGELYDIGQSQKLLLNCQGKGVPTVLLDAPTGLSSDVWYLIQPEIAKITKVCVYDRAGLGFSDRPSVGPEVAEEKQNRWQEFTIERMVDDLHRLVTYSSQQPRPLILVGSELGAMVARFYTQLYESDICGLFLIDPLVEDLFTQDSAIWRHFWFDHLVPSFQSLHLSASLGLTRMALLLHLMEQPIVNENIPQDIVQRQKHLLCNPRHMSSVVDEHYFMNETISQIRTLWQMKSFPSNISVTVLTGNYYDEQLPAALNKAWAKSQQNLISVLHPGSKHIVVNGADHKMLYKNPIAIIEPIKRLVRQWRSKLK